MDKYIEILQIFVSEDTYRPAMRVPNIEEFMKQSVQVDKSDFVNLYKPVKDVRGLVYDKN